MNKTYKKICFKQINSTNAYALEYLRDLSDRDIVISDKQINGKGRYDRKWFSEGENNVYMSIVLKPSTKVKEDLPLSSLTQYLSVVACDLLEDYGVKPQIKWPNDVLVQGKKIAGILSQMSVQGDNLNGIVLGIGINLNFTEEMIEKIDQSATSLNLLLGRPIHRDSFIEKLLDKFFENYENFINKGFLFIKKDYMSRIDIIDRKLAINTPGMLTKGIAKEIREDGSLVILDENNEEKIITMGDIICL